MKIKTTLWLLCALLMPTGAGAQNTSYGLHQKAMERINSAQNVAPLNVDTAFGEQLSLYNGTVQFSNVDISVPGNADLPLELRRSYQIQERREHSNPLGYAGYLGGFGEWDIDLPHLKGTFARTIGWKVGSDDSDQRCSTTSAPQDRPLFSAHDYWDGYHLHVPGEVDEVLLHAPNSSLPSPGNGTSYPWITKSMWRVRCKTATRNGYGGEAFIVISPDGVSYHLDWVVTRPTGSVKSGWTSGHGDSLARETVYFLVSRIEDRFGNWISYNWFGDRLQSITSNDGRQISLSWSGSNISNANSSVGGWTYTYSDGRLARVAQPDGSAWEYSAAGRLYMNTVDPLPTDDTLADCPHTVMDASGSFAYNVTAPSGASANYKFIIKQHYRHNVPKICIKPSTTYEYLEIPNSSLTFSLSEKVVTGPGIGRLVWNYQYGNGNALSFSDACAPPGSAFCWPSKQHVVTGPNNTWRRYEYGILYGVNEGQLLREESGSGENRILREQENVYTTQEDVDGQPFPNSVGVNPLRYSDQLSTTRLRPLKRKVITQNGFEFAWQVDSFDVFARPLRLMKASTVAGTPSRSEVVAYHDNLSKWILGQAAKLTVNGAVASEITYDSYAQPLTFKSFGKLRETRTYDVTTAGQMGTTKTVKDGNNNVTTFSSWKRGIPQSIVYADGTTQSAIVNDAGWVTRVTDENGFATNYAYDPMGRLSTITYPTGDSTAWNVTNLTLVKATSSAYGIPAGHWQHTVATDNGRKVTYLDALWRPVLVREYDTGNASVTQRFVRSAYDDEGRIIFVSYPSMASDPSTGVRTTYDALGRVTRVAQDSELGVLPTTTSYLSNADGYYTLVTDPKGNQTRTWYQAFDQPGYDTPVSIRHPEGAYTHITRDVFGKPTRIRRSNSSASTGGTTAIDRTYTYNANHELCRTVEPETGATLMGYDAAGNLAWSASGLPAGTACHATGDIPAISARRAIRSYDARNRIEFLSFPDNRGNTAYTYTPDGLPETIEANNGGGNVVTTTYNYNRRRLLTSERMAWGAIAWTLGTGYNANGHVVSHSYPVGGSIGYAPNALGQPTQVGSQVTGVTYHPNGAPKQFTYGNGVVHTMLQNGRGLPDSRTDAYSSTRFLHDEYDYDPNGNVAAITDGATGRNQRGNRDMEYDGLDRLTRTNSPMFGTAIYNYDVLDNLTQVKLSGGTSVRDHHYCYDSSWRLASIRSGSCGGSTVTALGYDEQGNLSNRGGVSFGFDYGNRLRSSSAGNTTYVYDGLGRRVRDATGGSRYSLYNQAGQLMFTSDHRKKLHTNYLYLGSQLVAQIDRSTVAPTGVPALTVPASSASGSFTASWTEVDIAERYELEQRKDGGTWGQIYSGIGLNRSITGLSNGSYEHRVRACTAAGCAAYSAIKTTSVILLPGGASVVTTPPNDSDGAFTVSWTAVTGAANYRLEQRKDGGAWVEVYSGTALSKAISGLGNGSYDYRGRACNSAGCAAFSGIVTTVVTFPPAGAPTVTTPAIDNDGTYTVSWTSVAAATSYQLQQRTNGGTFADAYIGPGFSKMLLGMAAGTWDYRVRACNVGGCTAYSGIATTVVIFPPTGVPTLTAPATDNNGAYTVSWGTVSAATSYLLQQRKDGGGWTTAHNGSASSKALSGLTNGSYEYRVQACNAGGCTAFSAIKTTVVTHPPGSAPTLTAPATNSNGSFTVSWTSVSGATSYDLWQRKDGSGIEDPWQLVYSGAALSKAMSGLANGRYEYQVKACNAGGCGSGSAVKVTVVTHPPGSVPTVTAPASDGDGAFTVSWTSVGTSTSYRLEQSKNGGSWSEVYNGSSRSKALSGLGSGSYRYRARACNAGGCSGYSAIKTTIVTFPPSGVPTLNAPAFVNSYLQSNYTVSWTSVATATRYELERHAGSGTWSGAYNGAGTSSMFASVLGYWSYRVRACNANGCGSFSSVKAVIVENMGGCRPGTPACQDPFSLPDTGEQL